MRKVLPLIALIVLLASCNASKKAHRYFAENPQEFAQDCGDAFPIKETIIKGDTVTVTDTLWGAGTVDTVVTKDTVRITKTLPAKIITNTRTIRDTIVRENTARVADLTARLNEEINKNKVLQTQHDDLKDKWRGKVGIPWWWLVIIGLALLGWAYWRIKAGALKKIISKLKT